MSDDVLSQDEINALLNDDEDDEGAEEVDTTEETDVEADTEDFEDPLSEMEKDAIGEVANISMGSAATALYGLLNKKVEITTPRVEVKKLKDLVDDYERPCVVVDVKYTEGLKGSNQLILESKDASIITDLMMGGDGTAPPEELSEMHISAVGEAMNQMMGSASTSMSDFFEGDKVNISPPEAELLDMDKSAIDIEGVSDEEPVANIIFDLHIGDLVDSQIVQVMSIEFAKKLASGLLNPGGSESETSSSAEETTSSQPEQQQQAANQQQQQQQPQQQQQQQQQQPAAQVNQQQAAAAQNNQQQVAQQQPQQQQAQRNQAASPGVQQENVEVQDVELEELGGNGKASAKDISLINDISLELTVRLGKTEMPIKDILDLAPGSVIELDRLAGEAVDLLANGKIIARGEVVVIDENFGFRVTDIISSEERLKKL
ncbi:flagellar motor switch phosphatase FliY [Halanaerobacter jeridensis]|uniref:Flagellar motor switch protein FliN/FliY n=1 Tax=Halanaerobacter jeridensis TaxID=706427 RepID=A0A939BQW5_9FIRM|nr:flagellar motor switch phosphatase FliY [Halanaerobacter jeridensis]MBM7555351.1 flagellar motor switch protein FliN/FliY [Halanaerobacter jeridensis]